MTVELMQLSDSLGKRQLSDYFDAYHLKKGYMLNFIFKKKEIGIKEIQFEDKVLVEAAV